MAQPLLPSNQVINWVLDWDGTITKHDTLDVLVNIAAQRKPGFGVPEKWKNLTQAYLSDYEETLKKHVPDGKLPLKVSDEKKLLRILEEVEKRSIDRVSNSSIFGSLTKRDVDEGAIEAIKSGRVQIREGYIDFVQALRDRKGRFDERFFILSVNWSQKFIAACLSARVYDRCSSKDMFPAIYANELEGLHEKTGKEIFEKPSTGHISPGTSRSNTIVSSHDKLERFQIIGPEDHAKTRKVYVGDSWTDLECLLEADLGICIRDDPMTGTQQKLADSLQRIGVRCTRLQDCEQTDEWSVVWARDFHEILHWLKA
ncbi:hypothetical protein N0V90_003355 [Kalmusia sp. IMI 367209]|nr:hypothetical protein N0V90_003355 [Kalmusia sp. IMI 367209]